MTDKQSFLALIRYLKNECPAAYPVRVRSRPLKKYNGLCGFKNSAKVNARYFSITIDSKLSVEAKMLVLLHEWAHALAWNHMDDQKTTEQHPGEFGVAYAKVFSVFDKWAAS